MGCRPQPIKDLLQQQSAHTPSFFEKLPWSPAAEGSADAAPSVTDGFRQVLKALGDVSPNISPTVPRAALAEDVIQRAKNEEVLGATLFSISSH